MHDLDARLLALIAEGDRHAFAHLYDRHARTTYGLAVRITRNHALAEESVQEAFLQIWRQAGLFDGRRAKPITWITTIVRRRAIDVVRREQLRRTDPIDSAPEAPSPTDLHTETCLMLDGHQVRRALALLGENYRTVIELAYFSGLSQSEVAIRLGEPLGTIKSRTRTALNQLRAHIHSGLIPQQGPGELPRRVATCEPA
jgi:RNA polymerase sigma-70 factor, ECF subfamily